MPLDSIQNQYKLHVVYISGYLLFGLTKATKNDFLVDRNVFSGQESSETATHHSSKVLSVPTPYSLGNNLLSGYLSNVMSDINCWSVHHCTCSYLLLLHLSFNGLLTSTYLCITIVLHWKSHLLNCRTISTIITSTDANLAISN